jgi:HEAT repeats
VALEGTNSIAVLFRVEHDAIEKVRINSLECPLDAGGLPFVWLSGVPVPASLSLLRNLTTSASDSLRDGAVLAISQHEGPEAITVLESLAHPPQPSHVRGQAIFWLAQRAGERAASIIVGAIENDPDTEVKKKAVFALSQLPRDEGVPRLIEVARQNRNREVRRQAFFWLGQTQDPRALAYIEQVLER